MAQEVVQWLNEIRALKEEIANLQVSLAESNASADRWRQLYETEAQQRRQDAQTAQAKIAALNDQITTLQTEAVPSELAQDRDRFLVALQEEKVAHEETRKNLTTALSDAMELLSKGKSRLPDVAES